VLVKDLATGGNLSPRGLVNANGKLFFEVDQPEMESALWMSNGTTAETSPVLTPGDGGVIAEPDDYAVIGGTLFFSGGQNIFDTLWKTDGTMGGTVQVSGIHPMSYLSSRLDLTAYGGKVLLSANGGGGFELWESDGTAAGTFQAPDIVAGFNSSSPMNI
jgi:ELWxxDGT repeat protein